jgi:hypothetical protein
MATAKIQSGMAHCIVQVAWHEFYSDGRLQAYSDYAVAKQETKITTGNGFNRNSYNSLRFLEKIKICLSLSYESLKAQAEE